MTEQEKLPPKLDLTEVVALQARLEGYFGRWQQWARERETWLIVANRADAFNDLAWLYQKALRLAVKRPDVTKETEVFVHDIVHEPGTSMRREHWYGQYDEENATKMREKCRDGIAALERRFEDLGVSWLESGDDN